MEVLGGVHPETGTEEISTQEQQVVAATVVADESTEVEKTLYDAEQFLSNYAVLREENEQLKHSNQQLEEQLEKARQDLEELRIEKEKLESELLQERHENKETLWKLREDYQKIQEDRLQWKEKYLNVCMKSGDSGDAEVALKNKKRKLNDGDPDLYSNIHFMSDHNQQPEVILTLVSEDSKSYKISIRECKYCGIGFCSLIGLNQHYHTCEKRPNFKNQINNENAVDCDLCSVKFPTHADLVQHNQFHEGTHRFLCRVCSRSYQSNPGRLKHEQLEHGSLPLLHCDACGKQFKRKDRLKDHIATKHSVETPHKCPYCDSRFKLRDYLRKHVNQLHPGKPVINSAQLSNLNLWSSSASSPVNENSKSESRNISISEPTSQTNSPSVVVPQTKAPSDAKVEENNSSVSETENTDATLQISVSADDSVEMSAVADAVASVANTEGTTVSLAKLITTEEGDGKIIQLILPATHQEYHSSLPTAQQE